MAVDTVVDAELWPILAELIGWIVLGWRHQRLQRTLEAAIKRTARGPHRGLRLWTLRRFRYQRDLA
jgi:uncharacterized membrane protein